jgi:hypothetical protein
VLCAYLRMPFMPQLPDGSADERAGADARAPGPRESRPTPRIEWEHLERQKRDAAQELQVRQTAQRLLAAHLRRPENGSGVDAQGIEPTSDGKFWSAISLDLTGVALVDFRPQPRIDRRRKFQTGDLHRRHLLSSRRLSPATPLRRGDLHQQGWRRAPVGRPTGGRSTRRPPPHPRWADHRPQPARRAELGHPAEPDPDPADAYTAAIDRGLEGRVCTRKRPPTNPAAALPTGSNARSRSPKKSSRSAGNPAKAAAPA